MASKSHFMTKAVRQYVAAHSARPDALLEELRAVTARETMFRMQVGPEQGAFLSLLVKLLGARRAIEIGTFTGYSALCFAMSMPRGEGRILCCDTSEEWTTIAREYWAEAGVQAMIDLVIAPAATTLEAIKLSVG
jgi:caffeoyl-CoA O-methyltransferase